MTNRFHNKIHRTNHHTYKNDSYVDSGIDNIASQNEPFMGDFILNGSLSASPSLSAYAGYFSTDADNATTLIIKSAGNNSTGLYVSGYNGIVTSTISSDVGLFNLESNNIVYPNFTTGYLSLCSSGNVILNGALSANSIWTSSVFSNSSIILHSDLNVNELSGFMVNGNDYNIHIPIMLLNPAENNIILNGIGLSGTSWVSISGDLKCNNIHVDNSLYTNTLTCDNLNTFNITVSNDMIVDNLTSVGYISGDTLYMDNMYVNNTFINDLSTLNINITGNSIFTGDLISTSTVYNGAGNSNTWNTTTMTVSSLSSNWCSQLVGFNRLSSDNVIYYDNWLWTTPPSDLNIIFDGNNDTHWGEATYYTDTSTGENKVMYWNLSGTYIGWVLCMADIKSDLSNGLIDLYVLMTPNSAYVYDEPYVTIVGSDYVGSISDTTYKTVTKLLPFYGNTIGFNFGITQFNTGYYKIRRLELYGKLSEPGNEPL